MHLVKDIGEAGLLAIVQTFCPGQLVGDDAALVSISPGQQVVVTTDLLVDGVHFSLGLAQPGIVTMTPEDVGWRAAAANLSDLAAMGARPLGITVGLSLPPDVPVAWIEGIYQGLAVCLREFAGGPILGGDVCQSDSLSLAITALGEVDPQAAIYRHRARPGDVILATGIHGAARAGLELLLKPAWGEFLTTYQRQTLIQTHQRPRPRLDVIEIIRRYLPTERIAGMDSSDGLADAVIQICQQSQTGAILWAEQLPLVQELPPELGQAWGFYGGEDFELVLTLAPAAAKTLISHLNSQAAIIGEITSGTEITLVSDTETITLDPQQRWQHFEV
ncbi:thiamine-phosphate kinase [Thermosynechococcaceae cyanobacterium BACA0444]|uniref:Thiamine-monophosphate kinase n=1 Tax=Pseudocalidococcus azoricus BACA0444 TaxID=2918990 RepID=A0AAE4FPB1_9CYAN|nr:thiamine-phosphate kinase [Pseudocalidococcus azoricus]MDS3859773.1 thiamine-phosphate kinase [Pseudocalidococcus azoricus BACA0444]